MSIPKPPMCWIAGPGVPECPKWLGTIARDVDELVQEPKNRKRFQQEILEWSKENAYDPEGDFDLFGEPFPAPTEMHVVLSAIHDSCCEQDKWICPWTQEDEESGEGTRYFRLMSYVPGMMWMQRDKRALDRFLLSVEKDLPVRVGLTETKQHGPKEKDRQSEKTTGADQEHKIETPTILSPIDLTKGTWNKGKNLDRLRNIDSNSKRDGIPGTKKLLREMKIYLEKPRHNRSDIADTLSHNNGRIITSMSYGTMFLKK